MQFTYLATDIEDLTKILHAGIHVMTFSGCQHRNVGNNFLAGLAAGTGPPIATSSTLSHVATALFLSPERDQLRRKKCQAGARFNATKRIDRPLLLRPQLYLSND